MESLLQYDPTGGFAAGAVGVFATFAFFWLVVTRPSTAFGLGLTVLLAWIAVLPWLVGSADTATKVAAGTLWSGVCGTLAVVSVFAAFED